MQASLCLQAKSHAGHHFAFNLRKSRTILHCHRQLSHSPSLLFSTRLHGGPRPRLTTPVMRARITSSEDSSLNKARKHAVRSAATAAMVIACTLGAMSTSFEARAYSNGDIPPAANFFLKETINALQGALECDTGPQKQVRARAGRWTFHKKKKEPLRVSLIKILESGLDSVALNKFKQILDIEKADLETISLKPALDAWNQIDERKQSDKYYIGMVLIDLLISKGEYKKAVEICRKIEGYQMNDGSVPVRREVLNALLKQAPGPPNVY